MTASNARRGRPKGSGIDDQKKLVEIGRLIGSDPRMKPTTAIKAIGVTDPSAIRRLRDKYNMAHVDHCSADHAHGGSSHPVNRTPVASAPVRAAPLSNVQPIRRAATVVPPADDELPPIETGHGLAALLPAKAANTNQIPVAAMLFGFGLNAATALFEQHMMIAQSVMKMPQVRDLFRQQIAFTEFMLNVATRSPGSRHVH